MKNENPSLLIQKYIDGTASPEEREQLLNWYRSQQPETVDWPAATETEEKQVYDRMLSNIDRHIDATYPQPVPLSKWYYIAAAAAIFLVGSFATFLYLDKAAPEKIQVLTFKNDIMRGVKNAIMKVVFGCLVFFEGEKKYIFAHKLGLNIARISDGQLAFDKQQKDAQTGSGAPKYNTISTPKGGQYRIILPDGTKVWLNAISSIRFPSYFSAGERRVEITGEAYFEVSKNKQMPFRVISGQQALEVLGTKFNINAYANEPQINTTLAEGSIRLNRINASESSILKPGEQAQLKTGSKLGAKIVPADLDEALAWKNDAFVFNDMPITEIMQQIERWYDIELVYNGPKPDLRFTGIIPRNSNLSTFLKVLEGSGGLKFGIDHKKVFIQSTR
jgi:transmembrane sensor